MKKITLSLKDGIKFFLSKKGIITHTLLFLSLLGATFYITFSRGAVEFLIDQTLERQKVVVASNANATEDFLDILGRSLAILSRDSRITSGANPKQAMDDFLKSWEDSSVKEVIYVNKEGEVRAVSNSMENDEFGYNVGDREYFIAAVGAPEGSYFIGEPIKARFGIIENSYLIPFSAPVYDSQGELQGVLGLNVALNEFVDQYLNKAKITEGAKIYLLNSKGDFIYNDVEEDIGKNVLDFVGEESFAGSKYIRELFQKTIDSDLKLGAFDLVLPDNFGESNPHLKRFLIAYAPLNISSQRWIIAQRLSAEDALAFIGPFYSRQIVGIIILFLVFLAISTRIARTEGFVEAINKGRGKRQS